MMIRFLISLFLIGSTHAAMLLASNVEKGRKIFMTSCAACHGIKGQGGPMCPQNNDASLELLKSKVLIGTYPKGYKPKKHTKAMPKFPFLKDSIEDIHKYLQSVK